MQYGLCGIDCSQCGSFIDKECKGCSVMAGTSIYGYCQWYHCCKDKGYEHCGKCDAFPCNHLKTALQEVGALSAIDNLKNL